MAPNLPLQADALHQEVDRLAKKLWHKNAQVWSNERVLIGIAGIPGAGKSTIAQLVAERLNHLHCQESQDNNPTFAVDLPMDGFHYPRAHLVTMPEPEIALYRRGAAFTFDAYGFYHFIQQLRAPIKGEDEITYAPSFDHAVKDPVANGIAIHPSTKVLLVEGNYLALDREPWSSAAKLMNELWFIDVDRSIARERLIKRHVASGICPDLESARHRVDSTDSLNADDALQNRLPVQELIHV